MAQQRVRGVFRENQAPLLEIQLTQQASYKQISHCCSCLKYAVGMTSLCHSFSVGFFPLCCHYYYLLQFFIWLYQSFFCSHYILSHLLCFIFMPSSHLFLIYVYIFAIPLVSFFFLQEVHNVFALPQKLTVFQLELPCKLELPLARSIMTVHSDI